MPELPDVEIFRRFVDETSLQRRLADVRVFNRRVLNDLSPQRLKRALQGRSFHSTARHGKHLFVEVDGSLWLVLHFGMTGHLDFGRQRRTGPHDRVVFVFADEYSLAFVCARLFGRITLAQSVEEFVADKRLGPDAMAVSAQEFALRVCRSRATIKSILMDQSQVAGIGNLYSDEILFRSRIHPAFPGRRLTTGQAACLYRNTRKVLRMAIEREADPWAMPQSCLLPHREREGCCPRCKAALTRQTVAGRTAYWCPQCQRR
ncbi:MAG: DNA-formamidopyrimidine glycosylase family protein [Sedimentisphaerales bacterium]|jgi:formamidopyrimidine-DNA glycosylase|nr:DNA-formamidopyrimidine glycosylase family protein [Sedimentisphaerales bacterium]HNY77313.1 DNA-formamidopyrimidine glycosylase family protein [Sedimentisphaerales bacterium]HOC62084.1 DNA-formamidopyrimidine glycosylase family protein [Sedimentisphaerales bacterium]HOH63529.1 DNA-formamidopyrimidine glycosylase family protein [Sedimentisphaerales bacterium]HPY50378.1 DNA-formamidopyrimidine glycosylase family protein [Sedimentisphaerales bacterium]